MQRGRSAIAEHLVFIVALAWQDADLQAAVIVVSLPAASQHGSHAR